MMKHKKKNWEQDGFLFDKMTQSGRPACECRVPQAARPPQPSTLFRQWEHTERKTDETQTHGEVGQMGTWNSEERNTG